MYVGFKNTNRYYIEKIKTVNIFCAKYNDLAKALPSTELIYQKFLKLNKTVLFDQAELEIESDLDYDVNSSNEYFINFITDRRDILNKELTYKLTFMEDSNANIQKYIFKNESGGYIFTNITEAKRLIKEIIDNVPNFIIPLYYSYIIFKKMNTDYSIFNMISFASLEIEPTASNTFMEDYTVFLDSFSTEYTILEPNEKISFMTTVIYNFYLM